MNMVNPNFYELQFFTELSLQDKELNDCLRKTICNNPKQDVKQKHSIFVLTYNHAYMHYKPRSLSN